MSADELHEVGSAIEAAAMMGDPDRPVRLPIPVIDLGRMLMAASARIRELESKQ